VAGFVAPQPTTIIVTAIPAASAIAVAIPPRIVTNKFRSRAV